MDLTEQEKEVIENLEMLIRRGNSLEVAVGRLSRMGLDGGLLAGVVEKRQAIIESVRHIAYDGALVDPEDVAAPWYTGPSEDDLFWTDLRDLLDSDPGWRAAIPAIDRASTDVVGLLADPHSPRIRSRGLVLGHVQSGKTANFTATIAKAADAGYRLFIVLSGVHNALRRQTQIRLDQQLYELNKTQWLQLTDEHNDFGNPLKALALLTSTELRLIAVVKKNVSRLTRLRNWLMQAAEEGGLDKCPVLIIDDESDQASPNAARNAELNRTAVNSRIVDLLRLPRVAYVGYTATPFANVLINPSDVADMYPRDFIYSLPKPNSYFGSEELFGLPVPEDEENEANTGHDMIRSVPVEEAALHSTSRKSKHVPVVTGAMADAIRWFILATTARRSRSGESRHSSMLIHTTMLVEPQLSYLPVIKDHIRGLRSQWAKGEIDAWRAQWEQEQIREPSSRHGLEPVSFEELSELVPSVLSEVRVVADNSNSVERLIYTDEPATVIAVGGNTLSRGLTLEGLVSSYFLRSAGTYDSLLQMGRWFGYRPGYSDLPRIWTTEELATDFRFLSEIEREIRLEIDRYSSEGATPREIPVRIRVHPRMKVTAASKMQFAVPGEVSYSGQTRQTTFFHHRDSAEIESNWSAAEDLMRRAMADGAEYGEFPSKVVLRSVGADAVVDFIRSYEFHPDAELRPKPLIDYIEGQRRYGALETWNIVLVTRQEGNRTVGLGLRSPVHLLTRSKLTLSSNASTANIGTLMSRPDRVADLMDLRQVAEIESERLPTELVRLRSESGRGLVVLYPIDKDSRPRPSAAESRRRAPLDAAGDLMGVGFVFPRAVQGSEPTDTIMVDPVRLGIASDLETGLDNYVDSEGDRDDVDLSDA